MMMTKLLGTFLVSLLVRFSHASMFSIALSNHVFVSSSR